MRHIFSNMNGNAMASPASTKAKLDIRLLLSVLLILAIAFAFWTGSRYPALDEKAAIGGDNSIGGLAFDLLLDVSSDDSILRQIINNAINWAYTNKQGMTFGVLFAAGIMNVLQRLKNRQFKGRFANTLLGVVMGAPLGVCVNCAVPIAMGTQRAGARTETSLAVLLSSPTLNVTVLGMTFALLPFWLASLKISLTLAFIILMVPFSVKYFGGDQDVDDEALREISEAAPLPHSAQSYSGQINEDANERNTWAAAILWLIRETARHLWFIIKLTVPLMFVAGLLGSAAITLLPWETLVNIFPSTGFALLFGLLIISIIGTFLPIPIAFDVVICTVLLAAGLHPSYVAALLITLGLFSIYPALQISMSISKRLALGLFGLVVALGFLGGLLGNTLSKMDSLRQEKAFNDILLNPEALLSAPAVPALNLGNDLSRLSQALQDGAITAGELIVSPLTDIEITAWDLRQNTANISDKGPLFEASYGEDLGLNIGDNHSHLRFLPPIASNRSIATGDIHGDGWPDIIMASDNQLFIFANIKGTHFEAQSISAPTLNGIMVVRAALADLDSDGDLDIIAGTYDHGVFWLENNRGLFETDAILMPGGKSGATVGAIAIADLDRDNKLDIVIGNRAIGNNPTDRTHPAAQNYILKQTDMSWQAEALPGPEGETLSVLLSDLNNDGWSDIFIGNDYRPPDHLLMSDGQGGFTSDTQKLFDGDTTRWTMSFATGDIDGDLIPEIYVANISGRGLAAELDAPKQCVNETGSEYDDCVARLELYKALAFARSRREVAQCRSIEDEEDSRSCAIIAATSAQLRKGLTGAEAIKDACDNIPDRWTVLKSHCRVRREVALEPLTREERQTTLPSLKESNVLWKRSGDNERYNDNAAEWKVDNGGWAWNARFADIDLDGRLDLYVVTGHALERRHHPHHLFMNQGDGFEDQADQHGLGSGVPTMSYSYVDFDRDGDLDLITLPLIGPAKIYKNKAANAGKNFISFDLRMAGGNTHAIGTKIIIRYGDEGEIGQLRDLQASGGFASQDESIVHYGLGEYNKIKSVELFWPDGNVTLLTQELKAGQRYRIVRLR